ncbi:retrovirus-related pol polyprotein from transposon TNT 1-94 [Tanacetum coccineum]
MLSRNTKGNRISKSSSSNKTNKVEDQSRCVKSRKNKKNRVAKTECNAYFMQSMLNVNYKSVCASESLFDANHDKGVLDYVHDVNVLSKSKPAKCKSKKQIWKPTDKVYTEIGYKWKPTGCTFTIVKNKCPLTRFTSTKVVPLKEITTKPVVTPTLGIMVYSRRPKAPKSVGCPNCSVVFGLRMLQAYDKKPSSATACYTQNRSLIRLHHGKTPYELLHDRKPVLSYLHVFGALCYPTNDSEDLGKLKAKADDTPLQPLFDEYFRPPPCVDHLVVEVATLVSAISTNLLSSTSIDQDAPSLSTSQTPLASLSYVIAPGTEEADYDIEKFSKGTVDPTLFIRREGKDILLVLIYVDDIISQSPRGIFLNQSKYALEIIKKYGIETSDPIDTPMVEKSNLDTDPQGKEVDPTRYRGMIGSLMYLTASRPDLQFVDSCIALTAFIDADHAGCQDTRRSTYESMQLLVPLLYVATMSNFPDPNILTSDTTSSKSKWKMGWLNCISLEQNINWQISLPRHWDKNDLTFLSTSLE